MTDVQKWAGVVDDESATWAMAKLGQAHQYLAFVDADIAGWRAKFDAWAEARRSAPDANDARRRVQRLTEGLDSWARMQRDAGRKSVVLPSGTIKTTGPAKGNEAPELVLEITDKDAVTAWAETELPEVVEYKPSVTVTRLRAADGLALRPDGNVILAATGEVVPGCQAVMQERPVKVSYTWPAIALPPGILAELEPIDLFEEDPEHAIINAIGE